MGVDQKTHAKIANHRVLSYDDIYELVKTCAGAGYRHSICGARTHFLPADLNRQLERLTNAGASADLVNYPGQSTGYFEASGSDQTGQTGRWRNHPYFPIRFFMGPPPLGLRMAWRVG